MNVSLRPMDDGDLDAVIPMATDHYNYHRKMTGAPAEFWEDDETSGKTVAGWRASSTVYIIEDAAPMGFMVVRRGGHHAAWLEELYVSPAKRGQGVGRAVMALLDGVLEKEGVTALFVDVIPRNERALDFYIECGFDHLNMLQLRKNYQRRLDKDETVDVLGRTIKKY